MAYDFVIVGAGIFGLTAAERLTAAGKSVLLLEKRDKIGGNAISHFDTETGIEVHTYGAHLFHTNNDEVWQYVQNFTEFNKYIHRVWTAHQGTVYPLPINLGTINQFFGTNLSPQQARDKIAASAQAMCDSLSGRQPANLIEQGVSLIGQELFDAFIKNYTAKQWQTPAEELDASIITRLPVRYTYDNRYFNAKYEGLPLDGYAALFDQMLRTCQLNPGGFALELGADYLTNSEAQQLVANGATLIYTGPIDQYYNYQFGPLNWRSLQFEIENVSVDDWQGCAVMNYADLEPAYTRIHEFKHFHPERIAEGQAQYALDSGVSTIVREYPVNWAVGDEPYYPIGTNDDIAKLEQYRKLCSEKDNIIFAGRLGQYAYFDMDTTFASALELAKSLTK